MAKFLIITLAFLLSFVSQAQNWEDISVDDLKSKFKIIRDNYANTPNYKMDIEHLSYKSANSSVASEQFKGYFLKHKNSYHSNTLGITTIQDSKLKITIDSTNKAILVSNPDESISTWKNLNDENLFSAISYAQHKNNANGTTSYKLYYKPNNQFKYFEIIVGESSWVQEFIIFYQSQEFYNPQSDKMEFLNPKIKVKYFNLSFSNINQNMFSLEKYLAKNDKSYKLTKPYMHYELIDTRYKP